MAAAAGSWIQRRQRRLTLGRSQSPRRLLIVAALLFSVMFGVSSALPPLQQINVFDGDRARGLGDGGWVTTRRGLEEGERVTTQRGLGEGGRVMKLGDNPVCVEDINRICGKVAVQNNFAVLDCLHNDLKKDEEVSDACQHLIWSYKHNLTVDFRFDSAVPEICGATLEQVPECKALPNGQGMVIPCLIKNIDNITNNNCKAFLNLMESFVFSDYRLIYKFAEKCSADIHEQRCGRLHAADDSSLLHNQGKTLTCLAQSLDKLDEECKHELLRVAKMQADDYHKDRQLFYACREDRENFCRKVKAGDGRVYKCLYGHKFHPEMSNGCLQMLTIRQQLQQADYTVNMNLARSCQNDIISHRCLNEVENVAAFKPARLSAVVLCLEGAMKDGKEVNPNCISELKAVRRSLMEDYQISPILARDCSNEIHESCGGGLHRDGRTIHCLMDLARPRKDGQQWRITIADKCARALQDVLEQADVGDNYEVDPAIQEDCGPVVKLLCSDVQPDDGRVMNCLFKSLDKPHMTPLCRERLMEIHYFITRDFRLDTRLYKLCRKDAIWICSAPDEWYTASAGSSNAFRPPMSQLVFACLYRHLVPVTSNPDYVSLSRQCSSEVRRVMRQRALSVDLDPQIEADCLIDLGQFCSDKTLKSEKMECLEYNVDLLSHYCKRAIQEYVKYADVAPELNDIFQLSCAPFWDKYCAHAIKNEWKKKKGDTGDADDDNELKHDNDSHEEANDHDSNDEEKDDAIGEDLMSCLIRYKYHPSMDDKCRAGIEHHQLITANNYLLSARFMIACEDDINDHCSAEKIDATKTSVVQCLSEFVQNDTILEVKHRISTACRKQLTFELPQRSSSIRLDPGLESVCKNDVESKCPNVSPGRGAVIACLRKNQKDLSTKCHEMIFKREREEAQNPLTDYFLMSKCKSTMELYCVEEMSSPITIFGCLQRNKEASKFDRGCFDAIIQLEELKAKDIRLNPNLEKRCSDDIKKHCLVELQTQPMDKEDDGRVLHCLRKSFAKRQLSDMCEEHVREVIVESAKDFHQDLELAIACAEEINQNCADLVYEGKEIDGGRVEDCLKDLVEKKRIKKSKCYHEVIRIIEENQADIHSDVRLFKACSVDLKQHCGDIPRGGGRQVACLVGIFNGKKIPLDEKCNETLSQRLLFWQEVASEDVVSLQLTANRITISPARNYFIGVVLVIVFIGGLFCGRATKRIQPFQCQGINDTKWSLIVSNPDKLAILHSDDVVDHDDKSPDFKNPLIYDASRIM